ncbi:MAG: hypothetical protein ABFD00_09820 [Chloroherpetonaceae bacterium]
MDIQSNNDTKTEEAQKIESNILSNIENRKRSTSFNRIIFEVEKKGFDNFAVRENLWRLIKRGEIQITSDFKLRVKQKKH